MIGASKILTVSYGTFSCTLEGFDDSFGTMKAIAEYFRDLAADDRYFGAEPATPDAEMLAKIAGREIKRQVEAKVEDNAVTLRPIEQVTDVEAPAQTPEPQPVAAADPIYTAPEAMSVQDAAELPTFEYDDAQDDATADLGSVETTREIDTESVAAKLRRIRAVVAQNQSAGAPVPVFSEDSHAEELLPIDKQAESEAFEAPVEDIAEPVVEVAEIEDPSIEVEVEVAEVEAPSIEIEDTEADTDISALMSRVSENVAEDAPVAEIADEYEDENLADEDDDALSNILNAVAKDGDTQDQNAVEDEVEVVTDTEIETEEDVIAKVDTDTADIHVEEAVEVVAEEALVTEVSEDDATPQPVTPVKPSRARIIKVKKADFLKEEADKAEVATEISVAGEQTRERAADPLGETNLSAEDEAELLAELADVEMEAPEDTSKGINAAMRVERTARALHDGGGAENEASVSRLLDETNAQLDTDESTRRRSAISHLRAAVAATVAERTFSKSDANDTPDEVDAYRIDLADAIRPQSVSAKGNRGIDRPSPLILVSEQRIDSEETTARANAGPIRPRRIRKSDVTLHEVEKDSRLDDLDDNAGDSEAEGENIFAGSTSFADFADQMGATELPDLLEAAAAYTAYVEGRPHFARPQIMRQVAGFTGKDEFNREEGLRSFGQLLRQGKIIKIKRGQFEIAGTTRFNPEARFAGE